MKKVLSYASLVGLFFLSGCASVFSDATSGPTAKLRLMSKGPAALTWIHTYEKADCEGPQFMGAFGVPDGRPQEISPKEMIGGASTSQTNVVERIIPARPTTILFSQKGPHTGQVIRACTLAVSFNPIPGSQYEIAYGYDDSICFADVNKLGLVDRRVVREPVVDAKKHLGKCMPFAF